MSIPDHVFIVEYSVMDGVSSLDTWDYTGIFFTDIQRQKIVSIEEKNHLSFE